MLHHIMDRLYIFGINKLVLEKDVQLIVLLDTIKRHPTDIVQLVQVNVKHVLSQQNTIANHVHQIHTNKIQQHVISYLLLIILDIIVV